MNLKQIRHAIIGDSDNQHYTQQGGDPLYTAHRDARIVIIGQAPGRLTQESGVPWNDAGIVGSLLGIKTIANEFVAYQVLAQQAAALESPRSMVIATYALCGFANFGSIAIQLGGISPIAPERRSDLARLGLRAMIGGTLAAFMTACVIGMLF